MLKCKKDFEIIIGIGLRERSKWPREHDGSGCGAILRYTQQAVSLT